MREGRRVSLRGPRERPARKRAGKGLTVFREDRRHPYIVQCRVQGVKDRGGREMV